MKASGNRVISVLAARNKDLIILENQVRDSSDEVIIMTDDGSSGRKGLVRLSTAWRKCSAASRWTKW